MTGLLAAYPSLAFPPRATLRQIVDEIVGAGGHEDDGDERRAQDAVNSGHVLKRLTDDMYDATTAAVCWSKLEIASVASNVI